MAENSKTFLRVTFRGGRFDRHVIPVDVLAELATLQQALIELASVEFKRRHPESRRRPRGFVKDGRLYLSNTAHNCFTASVERAVEPVLPGQDFESLDVFAHARATLLGAFRGDATIPEAHKALKALARFGDRLGDDEAIELRVRDDDAAVRVDHTSRARVAALLRAPLEQVEDLDGEVEKVDDQNHTFELRLRDRRTVRVPFGPMQRADVTEALSLRPVLRLLVRARVRSGAPLTASEVEEFDVVDHERRGDIEALWKRLEELAQLEDGWFNGAGLAPDPALLAQVRDVLARLVADHDVPRPKVFPLEDGGLQAEWMFGPVSADVCFAQDGTLNCSAVHAHHERSLDATFTEREVTCHDASRLAVWLREAGAL